MAEIILNTLSGTIYDPLNVPMINMTVQAFDKDLRTEQLLGQAVTDENGFYTISYDGTKYSDSEQQTADVFIRVMGTGRVPLGQSPVYFNVPAKFVLDFKIGNTPIRETDEFDELVQKIRPLTDPQKVALADLKEDDKFTDITFLSGETGEPREKLAFLPLAFTFSQSTKIPADIYYGLFRMSFPTDLNALLLVKSDSLLKGLKEAIDGNIISVRWESQLDKIISDLNTLSASLMLNPKNGENLKFKKVISTAIPTAALQKTFMNTWFENEAAPEKFWDVLATKIGFTDGRIIPEIRTVLGIHHLTGYEPSLTALLYQESNRDPELKDLKGFAKFTPDDWKSRITGLVASGALVDFPDGIAGSTPEEKTANYAGTLSDLIQTVYPTSVFLARMNKESSGPFGDGTPDLKIFFANNPGFDLATNRINTLFDGSKLDGVSNRDALKKQLKSINRLYKLSPQYEHVSALLNLGIGSATDIVQKYSADQLAQKLASANVGAVDSRAIYNKAAGVDKKSTALALAYKMRHDVPVYAIHGGQSVPADYESMFGDNNLCDCAECQSVYSPAAYLADVLSFLRKNNTAAFTKLTERRPDLIQILLTCENTNIPLPYIDLVNELLENLVVSQTTVAYQTESTAEELAAYPQNVLSAAYDKLKTSSAAYQLPLDLPLETSRKLLEKLELKRQEILELFLPKGNATLYTDIEIAREILGLSEGDPGILNGTVQIDGVTGDSPVPSVLQESQLTYIELLQALESYFVNPLKPDQTRTLKIVSSDPGEPATCDNSKLIVSGIDKPGLLKLIRFVRLQKRLNWSVTDLDRLLQAFHIVSFDIGEAAFNQQILIPIANIVRLIHRFPMAVQNALALFSPVGTGIYLDHTHDSQSVIPSLYDQLFRNKAVSNPVDEGFTPQAAGLSGSITTHTSVLLSAFNISPGDLTLLLSGNSGSLQPVDDILTLQNLSELYRRASFAALLKLSIPDFFDAVTITGINPLQDTTHTDAALAFADRIDFIKKSNFSLKELNYLLLNKDTDPLLAPSVEFIAAVLDPIRTGLKKISMETGADDLTADDAIQSVAEALVIDNFSSVFKTDHASARAVLDGTVKFTGDPSRSFLEALLASTFFAGTDPLFTLDGSKNAVPSLPDYFSSYIHAHKLVLIIKKLKLNADEITFLAANALKLSIDDLVNNSVPVSYSGFENISSLVRLRNTWKLPSSHLPEVLSIALKNEVNAKSNFISAISGAASVNASVLQFLLGDPADPANTGKLNFSFPDDYLNGTNMLQLLSCVSLTQKTGVDAGEFISAIHNNDSSFLTGLLKSGYTEPEWLNVIQPISNQLRTRRRDALVAFILHDPSLETFRDDKAIADTGTLFEHLLVDVETDACMFTSRIKQAISSVQLFIDRALMHLEDGVLLESDFPLQWNSWRKQYRVWEANRKVFLYPENWIEPELRDDKSPFFLDLESRLRQEEVTEDSAQEALLGYLEKLDAVANLEMIGIFPDEITGMVHAFGRTRTVPHQYFYRNLYNSVWSPLEKVDVDVDGDHVLPVVWNNRLMLFWGIFIEKQESNEDGFTVPSPGDTVPAQKYFEMKLGWSEYKKGKWSAKKISKEPILINYHTIGTRLFTKSQVSLSSLISDEKLFIRVIVPLRSDITTDVLDNLTGAFCFNGCNSSPSVIPSFTFTDGLSMVFVQKDKGYAQNQMFLTESNIDPFSVYDTGLYTGSMSSQVNTLNLFGNTPGTAQLLPNHHEIESDKPDKFFYSNQENNFFVSSTASFRPFPPVDVLSGSSGLLIARKEVIPGKKIFNADINLNSRPMASTPQATNGNLIPALLNGTVKTAPFGFFQRKKYLFQTFYHPFVCSFIKILNTKGIDGLYAKEVQNTDSGEIFTSAAYNPSPAVQLPYPVEKIDFDFTGVYSIYNWELFFHIPLLIATRLSQNQKFEEARKWFHYIFDPTRSSADPNEGAERFWITKPFRDEVLAGILPIEQLLDPDKNPDLQNQLDYWEKNPFNPHAVARLRLSAYMRTTLMKYIDNLVAWGDNLFQKDTIESINEATLLYILAGNILGKKPEKIPARAIPVERSFSDIQDLLDQFSNAKVEVQTFISPSGNGDSSSDQMVLMPMFCTPKNDQLLGYWDIVYDRLFKIRHCMNIKGVVRQLPLFEPPINPGLLVKATALGLDLNSIMNDITASLPPYRFQVMIQKAFELCNDVKGLGSELLSALEKGDGEQLSLIRTSQEVVMMNAVRDIKAGQLDEAKENLNSLLGLQATVELKRDYYASRPYKNESESTYFSSTNLASELEQILAINNTLASFIFLIPHTTIGPFSFGITAGGITFGNAAVSAMRATESMASLLRLHGEMANVKGNYDRRQDDWTFQAQSASLELKQMEKQIAAAEIRVAIAQKELDNHDLQIEHSKAVDDFMRSKFTREELYDYMIGQISSVYFQTYQMAYAFAKKTEKCLQHELGIEDTAYVQFGYWDSLKKGLLAGEKLQYDLRRLENAFLELNQREFEITKHISLATVNANAILGIRKNGTCNFQLPELLFEMDFPGHYFRRIRSVSVSIPCIAGPYTSVSSQLTLNKSYIRTKDEGGDLLFDFSNPASNYHPAGSAVKAIANSNGQNDTGMFEFNFRDERYLPFEGAGVISDWSLELPAEARQFDYNSVSDIIITVRYTARDAGNPGFKADVNTKIRDSIAASVDLLNSHGGLYKLLSMKNDFPDSFYQMKSGNGTTPTTMELKTDRSFFPFFTNSYSVIFKGCTFYNKDGSAVTIPVSSANTPQETIDNHWKLIINYTPSDVKEIEDLYLLVNYTVG